MKFFLVLAVLLCFLAYQVNSQGDAPAGDGEGTDPAVTTTGKPTTKQAEAGDEKVTTTTPVPSTTPDASTAASEETKSAIDQAYNDSKTTEKCKNNIKFCYGSTSTVADIKGKLADLMKADKEGACELIKDGKTCITTANSDNKCTDDEYEDLQEAVCFSPRIVASLFTLFAMCYLSKLLSQQ